MDELLQAYVFWTNLFGLHIFLIAGTGMTYWATKRLAVATHRRWLKKYKLPDTN